MSRAMAISLQEPWAWLIVRGIKDIENRSWFTHFRGRVLIHASKTFDRRGYEWLRAGPSPLITYTFPDGFPSPESFKPTMGGIVGEVSIVDCVTSSPSPWFFGEYGFVLERPKMLPFLPYRGKLGFFPVDLPESYRRGE